MQFALLALAMVPLTVGAATAPDATLYTTKTFSKRGAEKRSALRPFHRHRCPAGWQVALPLLAVSSPPTRRACIVREFDLAE